MTCIPPTTVAKWRALSDRRLDYMAELQRSGRWRLIYPTQHLFDVAMNAASIDAERWNSIAFVVSPPTAAEG